MFLFAPTVPSAPSPQKSARTSSARSVENAGSKKVAENCGYRYEGTMREAYFKDGVHEDTELWARLSTD